MTSALLFALLVAMPADEAVVRGTVVENFTGKLLNRALVVLEAMPGTPGGVRTVRTTRFGAFEFDKLAAGAYVLKASRRGFLPIEHGQKRWNSAGQPLVIAEATMSYITLRLPRYSAITGTVVDENEIGLPGQEVAVYRASQPPEYIRDAAADDRGVYRVGGLTPGKYFVRTVGKQYEDGSYLPTFFRETARPEQAELVEVFFEQQAANVDIRPLPGRLFTLNVAVGPPEEPDTVITLASAIGHKTVKGNAARFTGLAPGEYEVYAECSTGAAWQRLSLNSDARANLLWSEPSGVTVTGGPSANAGKLRIRRKDLAGVGPEALVQVADASIPAGRWELLLDPPDGYYVAGTTPYTPGRHDGWIEFTTRPRQSFRFRLTDGAATVHGIVKDAPYAPVYVEAYDSRLRQRGGDLKTVRADAQGQFRFSNLAPGTWRLLSTYEYLMPDSDVFDTAAAPSITVNSSSTIAKDLELWVIR